MTTPDELYTAAKLACLGRSDITPAVLLARHCATRMAIIDELACALYRVEWKGHESLEVCPDCGIEAPLSHLDCCSLAAALRRADR